MSTSETKLRLTVGGAVKPRTSVYIIRPSLEQLQDFDLNLQPNSHFS
jgi:hypothetical protein